MGFGELAGPTIGGKLLWAASGLAGILVTLDSLDLLQWCLEWLLQLLLFTTALNSGVAAAGGFASILVPCADYWRRSLLFASALGFLTMKQVLRSTTNLTNMRTRVRILRIFCY